ncbi:hypothetical protein CVT26_005812 [Gymnopilus dilepis]|uniref:Uncharacterized protein n=1 Tax=Gymnopilus dilepis TaxID=231916 RepID=A0A409WG75_9AGAR|nr:hypothetical protein CVT26_005812 [Gymnopilus dilepis]
MYVHQVFPYSMRDKIFNSAAEDISGDSSSEGYQQPEGNESSQSSKAADGSEDEEMLDVSE